jgi:hypothetical protein
MLSRVALVRTNVFEERSASMIRVIRIGEVPTGFFIPEDAILHSHRCENLNSYIALAG